MMEVSGCFSLLTRLTGIDVVFSDGIDAGEPVISSDQFDGFGDAVMSEEWSVIVISEGFQVQ